ncbi:TolB family protein [Streptacidiphilus sp. MAP12-16]|uniref:TolB family protein n=1 Tax=Streptacidiphilus sp. MAP12-16 TaxID=3156300 RepID=UPI0035151672
MSARSRLRTAAAIALTVAVTTGTAALLTGCAATTTVKASAPVPVQVSAAPIGTASASAAPTGGASAPAVNGTANSALTISNGTDHVLMNGTSVDFGTIVRDLAWSPDGSKAAFVNSSGDLVVANPDGSGRVVVARNPGGQTWSHPTWQLAVADSKNQIRAKDNLVFAVSQNGVSRLESVSATAVGGTPTTLPLAAGAGDNVPQLPQTGNAWPSAGGKFGSSVYANSGTGEVYIRDDYLRQQGGAFTSGSEPALSPDGNDIIFVRSVSGHDHVFVESLDSKAVRDLTPNATTDYTEPAWSPDSRTLAVRTPGGVDTVPANGSSAPAMVSTFPGLPAYRG